MALKARGWIVVTAGAAAVLLWFVGRITGTADGSHATDEASAETSAPAPAAAPRSHPMLPRVPLPPAGPPVAHTPDAAIPSPVAEADIVGPHPDDPHDPGMHPHPLTEAHQRLYAENHLVQRLNDAMAAHDVAAMRTLVAEYRRLDPADQDASQAGYALIADCLERPGPESLAAAQRFYDTARHSPLRRHMRRICFENAE